MVRRSGQRGVPVIVMDDQIVVGFNKARLEQLLASRAKAPTTAGAPARPSLGAQVADAATISLRQGRPALAGAYVGGVRAGSPGDRAGLRSGDIILGIDDHPIRIADDVSRVLAALPNGATPTLTIMRGDGLHKLRVEFGAGPPPGSSSYQYAG